MLARDLNNQISLQIIKALIEACHRDLNLFSKYIVKIFKMMLETKDIETMDLTCQVFVIFTSYHDGSTLGIDSEFTKDYEYLLKKFASFCSNDSNETTFNLQMRYIGQKALQAAVTSNALQASNFKVQLDLILLPLIHALSNSKNPANALAQSNNEDLDIREPTIGHETLNAHSVQVLAAKTVALLYSKTNSGTFKLSLNPLFTFMDAEEKWWPPNFVVSMMELVLDSLQSQHRYLLVSEILYQLENVKKATNVEKKDSKQKYASLVSILDIILNANIPLVGISVLEVLNTLFIHLIKSVQEFTSFKDKLSTTSDSDVQDTLQYTIQYGLAHCIGGLASQTYYLNQLNDITSYIISKLKVNHDTLDTIDGLLMKEYRHVVLKCLDLVAKASSSKQAQKEDTESDNENTSLYSNLITLDVWIPALETRIEFAEILVDYLEATSENDFTLEPYPKVYLVKDSIIKQASHQRAVAAIVIEWLMMTGNFYRISSLVEYAEGLKNERIQLNEYSSVFLDQDSSGVDEENDVNRLEELESDNNTLVSVFVDRKKVVDLLSKEGPLRDEDDTDGTDLENKLMVEWGSNVYVNHDRTFRIRTSRNLNDLKAKLTIPWAKSDLDHHEQDEKQAIRVENLKEALSGQLQNDMNHLQSLTLISLAKRNNEITNTDISLLLQSLSLGNDFSP
ncbi:uncharacterized protein BX663DRAFT_528761 [Cokeromyces recurvatus]|uniref:uncharacterized protein n=1 Tax=Cokeromyces recurvatus TaxID=90255 RepID=UPI0022209E83|nr:uncharacterized protein BX663DRAFT_528761 [Cokeromyces recurvatus]KAI7908324.1 hypothetical protein BX663DRAFT_528761 [Cokeromyces recurvatus]